MRSIIFMLVFVMSVGLAGAQQIVLQNDTVIDYANATIQAGFVGGEWAAAWLTSSCDGSLTAVQIFWASQLGGAPLSLQDSILINDAGAFPNPGTELASIIGPQLADGYFNEFTLATPIAVQSGSTYVVSLVFLDTPAATGPSVVTDLDGCQAGTNGILAFPPGMWFSSCDLGVSGDFAIRAVVECGPAEPFFEDGFESGNTSAWSGEVQ